jgi:hypothetical protein
MWMQSQQNGLRYQTERVARCAKAFDLELVMHVRKNAKINDTMVRAKYLIKELANEETAV